MKLWFTKAKNKDRNVLKPFREIRNYHSGLEPTSDFIQYFPSAFAFARDFSSYVHSQYFKRYCAVEQLHDVKGGMRGFSRWWCKGGGVTEYFKLSTSIYAGRLCYKIEKEHHLKATLRKQSIKHQN